ncbi:hypothetical protein N8I84_04980 [Streptomyces cynarae]|uniref:Hydrolase n=1 Tax=Streptomyces cynarae TaxID=2981134 RepID=A0ABY6DUW1_9ACTN|nr:hypothetical protein [Streptomyces cynarae]UXY18151.1 hypothetical protein N8I84_04980 [Streptomyces cynarae]
MSVTAFAPQMEARFALARKVADAVLFEGCPLHPYRTSAPGARLRRQCGVLVPPAWGAGSEEYDFQHTECLMEPGPGATLAVELRFLRARRRMVQRSCSDGDFETVAELRLDERLLVSCDEGTEERVEAVVTVDELTDGDGVIVAFGRRAGEECEQILDEDGRVVGRTVRQGEEIRGLLRLSAHRVEGPCPLLRLTAVVENTSVWAPEAGESADRGAALPHSLISTHLLMGLSAGSFLSMSDPPEWARAAIASCRNLHTWPVLSGEPGRADVMLSSPVVLEDHPRTDPQGVPPADTPWRDPVGEPGGEPEGGRIVVNGRPVGPGSRVRLNPGLRRTDAQDVFLRGRPATVEAVRHDVDGSVHLAVTVDDDPGADVRRERGTFHYFRLDEVTPLEGHV